MHKAWSSIEEVSYCFSRSSVKNQGHTALKIIEFDPNWAFPDCNSSLNSPMTMKCYTKLETAKERCPIVFQGHPSNFKVTQDKTSPILTQIGRFRTIGWSQLSNPSDLPCSACINDEILSLSLSLSVYEYTDFQIRIFLCESNRSLWLLHMLGFCRLISLNSVLAPHFHWEARIPKCISRGNPLKNMGCTDPQLPLIWKPAFSSEIYTESPNACLSPDLKVLTHHLHHLIDGTSNYASALRRRRHYVFGLSVRPSVRPSIRLSVRSLKYPLLTCTWVRWSTRPTVTILRHVRPSVPPERFPGICRRMHEGIGLKFIMLMYLDHLQNWFVYGCGLLIFLILALFWLSEMGQIWGFRAFPRERMGEMAWNFARWCILTTFRTD